MLTLLGAGQGSNGVAFDADAQAFITAASISDGVQQTAINTLVVDLKANSIWTKMKALYPFVGGTASTHKWNLKDPRDLDAAYRLLFSGGLTHSSTGVLPNGSTGYMNTKLIPNTALTLNNTSLTIYIRNNTSTSGFDIGSQGAVNTTSLFLITRFGGTGIISDVYADTARIVAANTDSRGFYVSTRTSSSSFKVFKNGVQQGSTIATTAGTLPIFELYICANAKGLGNPQSFTDREVAFASIGDGLTDGESSTLYTLVQAFQVTLSRQV